MNTRPRIGNKLKTEKWYRVNQEGLKELQPSGRAKKKASIERAPVTRAREQPLAGLSGFFTRSGSLFYRTGCLEITEREVNQAAAYYEGKEQTQALL